MSRLLDLIDSTFAVPLFGAPLTVMGMALGGALVSFAYGDSEKSRLKLFFLVVANTFLGTIGVVILPAMLGWNWVTPLMQPPLAGALSFAARFAVPVLIEVAPQWAMKLIGGMSAKAKTPGDAP